MDVKNAFFFLRPLIMKTYKNLMEEKLTGVFFFPDCRSSDEGSKFEEKPY